ncbi:MAG TPA: DUF3656 domain-containing protein [Phycisphaerae bacterium]|nr:DUF3656 domain-containing protein [Phycisphaerae bacterium]
MALRSQHVGPPELLAPAGDEQALRAAVANGADAVYFGLDDFNARRRAANFTLAALPELVRWLHHRNVKAYVTFNTLIFSSELERAQQYIAGIAEAGADAVIVQDLGLVRLIRAMCPTLPIHASTQATQTHAEGIAFLKRLGVSRVILAREMSLEQIEAVARTTDVELEVFVHGAICISFSGQCLASETFWGRSANRGLCAQACRLPYELVVDDQVRDLGERRYLLSPRDLAAADLLDRLVALGVAGLKIEGRLKGPAYVASATRVYREVLDKALRGEPAKLTREQELELTLSFSRGFTTGFLEGRHPGRLVDGRFPRSRGLLVGHVDGRTARGIVVRLSEEESHECPLSPGDGVVFDEGRPERKEQGGRVYEIRPRSGRPRRVEIMFGREDVDIRAVAVGSRVWKTDDPALRRRLERSARKEDVVRRVLLYARVEAAIGQPLRLSLQFDPQFEPQFDPRFEPQFEPETQARESRPLQASVESPKLLEQATRHPLTVDLLREQMGRLGDTPFELAGVELIGPEGTAVECVPVMAPKSLLNDLRRRAVEMLMAARDVAARHAVTRPAALEEMRAELSRVPGVPTERPAWSVLVRTAEQLRGVVDWLGEKAGETSVPPTLRRNAGATLKAGWMPAPLGLVYVDATLAGLAESVRAIREAGCLAGLATPQITMPGEERFLDRIVAASPDVVLVRSLAALEYLRKHAPGIALVADHSLNVANELAADLLAEAGFARITPAYDLDIAQLAALRARAPGVALELIVHGHVPLFHTAHCLISAELGSGEDCGRCGQRFEPGDVRLRDRNGQSHPLLIDTAGRTTIFNATAQTALGLWSKTLELRPGCLRLELLRESAEEAKSLLDLYGAVLSGTVVPAEALRRLKRMYPAGASGGTWMAARRPAE